MKTDDKSAHRQPDDARKAVPERLPIEHVADMLAMRGTKPIVAICSPSGDDGSTATVMLARAISEAARSVVLVDMTASGAPSRLMASQEGLPGIMDLLMGDAAFGETIHSDRLSTAHIVPQGVASGHKATGIVERLTMVLGALSGSYDTVLLEFGPAQPGEIARLLNHVDADIIVSLPDGDSRILREATEAFEEKGHTQLIAMVAAGEAAKGARQ